MSAVTLIFPHQLFKNNPAISSSRRIVLIEEYLFFRQYNFHKQKLIFHRATMQAFKMDLEKGGYSVTYVDSQEPFSDVRALISDLRKKGIKEIHFTDTSDNWLQKRIYEESGKNGIKCIEYVSPLFLNSKKDLDLYFKDKKKYFQTDFYVQQRKSRKILVDDTFKPIGGKWTFDAENRLKYPKGKVPPSIKFPAENIFVKEAEEYVLKHFLENYGEIKTSFRYPTTHAESKKWFKEFLTSRFAEFGDYEDAMVMKESILHHSVLTPMLNVGLLTAGEVLADTLTFISKNNIPLNSAEGFLRQIIGWREFIRGVYEYKGVEERTTNSWGFKRKIPRSFWDGTTGIDPVDVVIRRVLKTGYCHHIERLMVLGNFMLLCEFDPDEVYRWFMELFIDSYDWVMVPNVYGMSQFADGGLMATKPYISGSNYIMKMSDFPKGPWQGIWDSLFWRFMNVHRDFFLQNPRLGMLIRTFDKMPTEKQKHHMKTANDFLETLV